MGDNTGIEWTDASWNPLAGCSVVSPGCTNCYAMKMAARLDSMDAAAIVSGGSKRRMPHYEGATKFVNGNAVWTGKVAMAPDSILLKPLQWKRPRKIFVNSMSDLFHESVPDEWIDEVFAIMALCPQHTFQVLTKRSKRMREYLQNNDRSREIAIDKVRDTIARSQRLPDNPYDGWLSYSHGRAEFWPTPWKLGKEPNHSTGKFIQFLGCNDALPLPNVWLGVSAEDQTRADERIPDLLATPAAVRFVSAEPLLGPIDFEQIKQTVAPGFFGDCLRWHHRGKSHLDERIPYPRLDWIIVGAESGPGARHMDDFWALTIVLQCQAAGVKAFVKQLSSLGGRPVKDIALFPPSLQVREFPGAAA